MSATRAAITGTRASLATAATLAFLVLVALLAFLPDTTHAHAELIRTDPPIDGLVVSPPDTISLSFTEEVVLDSPAPTIEMLDQQGTVIGEDPLPILPSDDPRTLIVDIPDLDRGTFTVSWTVTSATDGHTLSGTYAFRVGGGLPPSLAASSDSLPAAWAVVTRWITFLGASIAAGLFLFGELLVDNSGASARWRRNRAYLVLGGSLAALVATIAEPVIQWQTGDTTSRGDVIRSMPGGWWWRPALLGPLTVLAAVIAYPMRGEVSRIVAWTGSGLALGSLLGLIMTSHAAGRERYREIAIASDALHQWSVALWCGGLVALVAWAISKAGDDPGFSLHIKRFSRMALVLVAIAVVTGLVNTGFVFPFVDQIREDGWSTGAFESLWTSNYGVVLLLKLLVLIVPLALAYIHRATVMRLASSIATITVRFERTLRIELALVTIVILGGSAMALSSPPAAPVDNPLDRITLVASTSDTPEPGSILAHLTIDPARVGDNTIEVRLTDWEGAAVATDPAPRVNLTFTSLDHGTVNPGVNLQPASDGSGAYRTSGLGLSLDGWWQIDATIQQAGQQNQLASFNVLLPDPNFHGFDAPPKPESDPAAQALFETAYAQMLTWERVRWTEDLGSGSDVLVRAAFAVIDGGDSGTDAYSLDLLYSGGFAPTANGVEPRPPAFDSRSSVTIGDQGWLRTADGEWLEEPPTNFQPPSEWNETYAGAGNFRMGITQGIDGVELQVVTFYLPEQPIQSEAWFAWWIDPATGDVVKVAMIARQHYMVWSYTDVNGDFTIEPPAS